MSRRASAHCSPLLLPQQPPSLPRSGASALSRQSPCMQPQGAKLWARHHGAQDLKVKRAQGTLHHSQLAHVGGAG